MLKISQISHQALAARYKALKIQSEDLVVSRKLVPKGKAPKVYLEGMNKEISLAGGRFCMVGELWVDKDTLDLPFPENFDLLRCIIKISTLELMARLPNHIEISSCTSGAILQMLNSGPCSRNM